MRYRELPKRFVRLISVATGRGGRTDSSARWEAPAMVLICVLALQGGFLCAAPVGESELFDHFAFREIGPTRQGGRVVAFAVSETDPSLFFVAAGPGGLWKTVNNGTTFETVFSREAVASIGYVAIARSDSNVVWVGTG